MRKARKTKVHGRAQRRARARSRHGASDTHLCCVHTHNTPGHLLLFLTRISDLGSYTKFTEIPVKLVTVSIPAQYFPSIHTYTGATDSLTSSDATFDIEEGSKERGRAIEVAFGVCAFVCCCSACGPVSELEVCWVRFARVSCPRLRFETSTEAGPRSRYIHPPFLLRCRGRFI